jgi:hypothetical protein
VTDKLINCPAPHDVDLANACATLTAGEHSTTNGEPGWDVSFDRVIDQPGKPEVRQHFSVHYPMLPNKILVGTTPGTSTTTPTPSTAKAGPPTTAKSTPTTAKPTSTTKPKP